MPSRLIERDRLLARLNAAARLSICMLDAPAGFGKSVLLRQFLTSKPELCPVRYDAGGATSLPTLARGLADALGDRVPAVRLSFGSALERASQSSKRAAHLAYWLIEHLRDLDATVVVDQFNAAAEDAEAAEFLGRAIDGTRASVRWIVATRSGALLRVPTWMANGLMDRAIDGAELAFDDVEIERLAHLHGRPVPRAIARWPAGAAFELRVGGSGPPAAIADGDFNALSAHVVSRLSAEERAFVERTALLSEIDAHLAAQISGLDAECMFEALESSHPWVFSRTGRVLHYHDRFTKFLERELLRRDPVGVDSHVTRLAQALEGGGNTAGALRLLTHYARTEHIASLLEAHGFELIESGHAETVAAALALLDRPNGTSHPIVMAVRAMLDANHGRFDTAEAWYQLALASIDDERRGDVAYRYAQDLVRSYRVDWIPMLEPYADDRGVSRDMRAMRLSLLAQGYAIAGESLSAAASIGTALALAETSNDPLTQATVSARAAFVALSEGKAGDARSHAERAAAFSTANALFDVASRLYTVLFQIAYDLEDDSQAAFEYLGLAADFGVKAGNMQATLWALAVRYSMLVERGDEDAADDVYRVLDSFDLDYVTPVVSDALLPSQALRAAWRGDFAHAYNLLLPSAGEQGDAERDALRWAEVAFYAAAARLHAETRVAVRRSTKALRESSGPSSRTMRATSLSVLALALIGRLSAARHFVRHMSDAAGHTPRTHALHAVANAFADWRHHGRDALGLATALRGLSDVQLGGIARAIEAIPVLHPAAQRAS